MHIAHELALAKTLPFNASLTLLSSGLMALLAIRLIWRFERSTISSTNPYAMIQMRTRIDTGGCMIHITTTSMTEVEPSCARLSM